MISSSPLSASLLAQRLPFSGGRIFIVLCFISFVKCSAVPASFRHPSRSIPAPNPHPRGSGQRSWTAGLAKPDRRGKMQKRTEESLLSSGRFKFFPAAGHARSQLFCPPIPPNQLSCRKQVLCFFPCTPRAAALRQARVSGGNLQNCSPSAACGGAMTQERNVPLVSFVPLRPQSNALLQGWRRALLYCFLFMHIRKARAAVYDVCRPMCTARYSIRAHRSIGPRPSRTTPQRCASTQISRSITVLARPITGRG